MFNAGEAEWRVRASKDVRVVAVMEASDCENGGNTANKSKTQ